MVGLLRAMDARDIGLCFIYGNTRC